MSLYVVKNPTFVLGGKTSTVRGRREARGREGVWRASQGDSSYKAQSLTFSLKDLICEEDVTSKPVMTHFLVWFVPEREDKVKSKLSLEMSRCEDQTPDLLWSHRAQDNGRQYFPCLKCLPATYETVKMFSPVTQHLPLLKGTGV